MSSGAIIIIREAIMIKSMIHQMKGNEFPFGQIAEGSLDHSKMLIRKRIHYRNSNEYALIRQKVDRLKTVSHRNCINLRQADDDGQGFVDLYYGYVPMRLEEAFGEDAGPATVKELHKQFIELAIHLAKHSILTSFSPNRCGVTVSGERTTVKYFLPLNEIVLTSSISMLERSVQLFNLQSMHYLDTLCQGALNSTIERSHRSSRHSISRRLSPQANRRLRKESQPVTLYFNSARKMSLNPLSRQMRKLSHLSKELSQFSQMRKRRTKESTRNSADSFSTIKNLLRPDSERDLFNSYHSENRKVVQEGVMRLKERSTLALREFKELKQVMAQHRSLSVLLERVRGLAMVAS